MDYKSYTFWILVAVLIKSIFVPATILDAVCALSCFGYTGFFAFLKEKEQTDTINEIKQIKEQLAEMKDKHLVIDDKVSRLSIGSVMKR